MRCVTNTDLTAFAEQVSAHLHRDPVRHNVACTVVESRLRGITPVEAEARWLRVLDDHDRVVTAAMRTPPHPLLLTDAPLAAIDALVDELRTVHPDLPSVTGPAELASRFAERWSTKTGVPARVTRGMRMFRLDSVTPPAGVPGRLRMANDGDRALLVGWLAAFQAEAMPDDPHPDAADAVDRGLGHRGGFWLWEAGGEPVSVLRLTPPVAGVVRAGAVYTPPPRRGSGYASASVAAASQWALEHGAGACMLYTDLANPTSNKIYQAIGYRPVGDATEWRLSASSRVP